MKKGMGCLFLLLLILSGCSGGTGQQIGLHSVSLLSPAQIHQQYEKQQANQNDLQNKENDERSAVHVKHTVKPEPEGIHPVRIQIPAIKVDAKVVDVGILENGAMGVPEDWMEVGWFEPGYKPGSYGNAVMAGHVDSYKGAAVFFDLDQLRKGDHIIVTDDTGKSLIFAVQKSVPYKTEKAPVEEIFGDADAAWLNLITCEGNYNEETQNRPLRRVVYSKLVDIQDTAVSVSDAVYGGG